MQHVVFVIGFGLAGVKKKAPLLVSKYWQVKFQFFLRVAGSSNNGRHQSVVTFTKINNIQYLNSCSQFTLFTYCYSQRA